MSELKTASYGSWKSPITSSAVSSGTIRLGTPVIVGETIYWLEMRPSEAGRTVIVQRTPDGRKTDVTPAPFNVRTRVHEYGGGALLIHDDIVYFSNFTDQRLYRQEIGSQPVPLTSESGMRYANGVYDSSRKRIICVGEDHSINDKEPVNNLVAVDCLDGEVRELVFGNDFYSSPRINPEGTRLAWLTWNHPDMPWDGTELWTGDLNDDGSITNLTLVSGSRNESICQPKYSPDGVLYFVSDTNGWWNIYRWVDGKVEPVIEMEAEFGAPDWVFGRSNYDFEFPGRIICTYTKDGTSYFAVIDIAARSITTIDVPYSAIDLISAASGKVVFLGGSPKSPEAVVLFDIKTGNHEVLQRSTELEIDDSYLSAPQSIEFPTEQGLVAYAFYYPPKNRDYAAPLGEKPPLLVISHGGPTSNTSSTLSLPIQYWTSRGIAVIDVDYGGSTGYGREYRQRLNGQWGIVDVDDCANAARYLIERGEVDAERVAIRGGSAGGYTTLAALAFRDVFKAGASYYGVSDTEALAKDTHKFESRYLDGLIGPYPERRDLYTERSPIHHIEGLSCPVIFFQGSEDKIVPPNQAEMMVDSLRAKVVPVAYVLFEGEQHGFRQSQNIKRALDAELYFYSRIFGFDLAEPVEPVVIDNL